MTLKLNRVRAKYHQAECSGLWVIVLMEKKKNEEENSAVRAVRRYLADSKNKS